MNPLGLFTGERIAKVHPDKPLDVLSGRLELLADHEMEIIARQGLDPVVGGLIAHELTPVPFCLGPRDGAQSFDRGLDSIAIAERFQVRNKVDGRLSLKRALSGPDPFHNVDSASIHSASYQGAEGREVIGIPPGSAKPPGATPAAQQHSAERSDS